jgi:hypothetical protein
MSDMSDRVAGWLTFIERHALGEVAYSIETSSAMILIRRPDAPRYIALLEEWQAGASVYQRRDLVGTLYYASRNTGEQGLVEMVRHAQQLSAEGPVLASDGGLDQVPTQTAPPPSLFGRAVLFFKDFFA